MRQSPATVAKAFGRACEASGRNCPLFEPSPHLAVWGWGPVAIALFPLLVKRVALRSLRHFHPLPIAIGDVVGTACSPRVSLQATAELHSVQPSPSRRAFAWPQTTPACEPELPLWVGNLPALAPAYSRHRKQISPPEPR